MVNWQEIHPDFTEELQREWEAEDFKYKEVRNWVKTVGLRPDEAEFASWLEKNGYRLKWLLENRHEDIEELRQDYQDCEEFTDDSSSSSEEESEGEQVSSEDYSEGKISEGEESSEESEDSLADASNWLKDKYQNKKKTKKIELEENEEITGSLTINNYKNLEEVDIRRGNLARLEIKDCPKLEKLNCGSNELEELIITNCKNLENLNCCRNQLTSLDISDNESLTRLCCHDNELVELKLNGCVDLKYLRAYNNELTELDLSDNSKLRKLDIQSNNFPRTQNLEFLSHLVNLRELYLGNNNEERRTKKKIYNKFGGSLESLKELTKLRELGFENTRISASDIPESLENLSRIYGKPVPAEEWLEKPYHPSSWRKLKEIVSKDGEIICGELIINDFPNLEEIDLDGLQNEVGRLTKLEVRNCPKLTKLSCDYNRIGKLNIANCPNLKEIYCGGNQLTHLNVSNCPNLEELHCWENLLTQLDLSKNWWLRVLDVSDNNFPKQDLSFLSHLVNLEKIYLGNDNKEGIHNRFAGSLEPLKYLTNLEYFDIDNTYINSGPLPPSLDSESRVRIESLIRNRSEGVKIEKVHGLPHGLEKGTRLSENNGDEWTGYKQKKIYPEYLPQNWINEKNKLKSQTETGDELPIKLYNLKEDEVEETNERNDIKSYAILSYVWGEVENEDELTPLGRKSLSKAIKALEIINEFSNNKNLVIKHLWMDQLCIDQGNDEEKAKEVPKMRQYYGNATVTLISMQMALNPKEGNDGLSLNLDSLDALGKIVNSQWFSRSWTFQEGWLSKQTIFMFDDYLIDGRHLAAVWVINQPSRVDHSFGKIFGGLTKIATPIGWTYYKNGYDLKEDSIFLRLDEALRAIKSRGRGIAIDGIYSILGLLPYGSAVEVDYSINPSEALVNVMKAAVKKGIGAPIAWHGSGEWMPEIEIGGDHEIPGSTKVEGGIEVECLKPEKVEFTENSIKLKGLEYEITKAEGISKVDESFFESGGIHMRSIKLKNDDEPEEEISLTLAGTKEVLEAAKEEIYLLVINKGEWQSEESFALLATKENDKNGVYRRIGLVEIITGSEQLNLYGKNKLEIGSEQQFQTQIQVPPKKSN